MKDNIKLGIGFATGRRSFKKVLKTYIYNWVESGMAESGNISLNLFVAYDLSYNKTEVSDYTGLRQDILEYIDSCEFIGKKTINSEIKFLSDKSIISPSEASKIFGRGYGAKRNAILYFAIKNKMDYLIFLDDDEYPLAVTNTKNTAIWGGQQVFNVHLKYISQADITHGNHCGYVSPIPYIDFNNDLTQEDFHTFIEAISNDIVNWDDIVKIMNNGGVTYADTKILTSKEAVEALEVNHTKFISGANLCINLKNPMRIFPFYNPPRARGEDTFLSTCLGERKVLRVPCYTFHDGFSTYNNLLDGVLPIKLRFVRAENDKIIDRFYKACIGWIRYKPLLVYITHRDIYQETIKNMTEKLETTIPKVCTYFKYPDFIKILYELKKYSKNVQRHFNDFESTKKIWKKIMEYYTLQES